MSEVIGFLLGTVLVFLVAVWIIKNGDDGL